MSGIFILQQNYHIYLIMTIKPILMIHEVTEDLLSRLSEINLQQYTITFDDGLYSQFEHFEFFDSIPTEKIFFISTAIISPGNRPYQTLTSIEAHNKTKQQNFEDYMTVDDIRGLYRCKNVEIGGHGNQHLSLKDLPSLFVQTQSIKDDTKRMLDWFDSNLSFRPTSFCFPYNDDLNGIYPMILKQYGFSQFYGRERIDVNTLL
jgi:hypothetical protein